eukprot:SAG11_NODE_1102_length_5866_cov_2.173574_6_plen_157_part_00
MREVRIEKIRENYLRGWFIIDFVSCLPVGYVNLFVSTIDGDDGSAGGAGGGPTRAFKTLRLLRLGKMLRVAKVLKLFEKYADVLSMYMGVYIMVFTILFSAHLMSCIWYSIGCNSQVIPMEDGDELVQGWVEREGWDMENVGLQTRYLTSLAMAFP